MLLRPVTPGEVEILGTTNGGQSIDDSAHVAFVRTCLAGEIQHLAIFQLDQSAEDKVSVWYGPPCFKANLSNGPA